METRHRAITGDARDLPLPDDSVELVVTSPPSAAIAFPDGASDWWTRTSSPRPAAWISFLTWSSYAPLSIPLTAMIFIRTSHALSNTSWSEPGMPRPSRNSISPVSCMDSMTSPPR